MRLGESAAGPVSFVQEEILTRMLSYPDCATRYDCVQIIALRGLLDTDRLKDAVAATTRRHPILRTRICRDHTGFVQSVVPPDGAEDPLHLVDQAMTPEEFTAQLHAAKHDAAAVLCGAPLFRLHLVRAGPEHHLLGVLVHHLVIDSAGYRVLWRDISAAYNASILPPAPPPYLAHAEDERAAFDTAAAPALAFWHAMNPSPAAERPATTAAATERLRTTLDGSARAGAAAAARRHRMSPFLVVLAASAQAYAMADGRLEQLTSTDFENREVPDRREHVAPFINSRLCLLKALDRPLDSILPELREMWLDAEKFRDLHAHPLRQRLRWHEALSVQLDARDAEVLPALEGVAARAVPDLTPEPYWRDALLSWRLTRNEILLDLTFRPDRLAPETARALGWRIAGALAELG